MVKKHADGVIPKWLHWMKAAFPDDTPAAAAQTFLCLFPMLEFQQSLAGPPCTCGNSLAKQFPISDNLPENIWCQGIVDCEDMPMHLTEFAVPLTCGAFCWPWFLP